MATLNSLARELVVGLMNAGLYFPEHARVKDSAGRICALLVELEREGHAFPLELGVAGQRVVYQGQPLFSASLFGGKLTAALAALGSGGLQFGARAEPRELIAMLCLLSAPPAGATGPEALNALLEAAQVASIRFLAPLVEAGGSAAANLWQELDDLRVVRLPVQLYQDFVDLLQTSAVRVVRNIEIEMDRVYALTRDVLRMLNEEPEPLLALARHGDADNYNLQHSIRVCLRVGLVARELVSDRDLLLRICQAALLHDVGKNLVAPEIINKPGRLLPDERREIEKHSEYGARILLEQPAPDPIAVTVAYSHHLRHDGTGYPKPPHGFRLHPISQLIQICDVYEALTAQRPYKPARSPQDALREMMRMRRQFHPRLFPFFVKCTGLYPVGTLLELGTGEIAQVRQGSHPPHRPRARILQDRRGRRRPLKECEEVQLELTDARAARRVTAVVDAPDLLEGLLAP